MYSFNDIHLGNPYLTISTDVSSTGWGGAQLKTRDLISDKEARDHINVLELKAVLF